MASRHARTRIDDAVNGTILALERGAVGGIYNIGGGRTISLNDAIGLIAGHVGVEPIVHQEPRDRAISGTRAPTSVVPGPHSATNRRWSRRMAWRARSLRLAGAVAPTGRS